MFINPLPVYGLAVGVIGLTLGSVRVANASLRSAGL